MKTFNYACQLISVICFISYHIKFSRESNRIYHKDSCICTLFLEGCENYVDSFKLFYGGFSERSFVHESFMVFNKTLNFTFSVCSLTFQHAE